MRFFFALAVVALAAAPGRGDYLATTQGTYTSDGSEASNNTTGLGQLAAWRAGGADDPRTVAYSAWDLSAIPAGYDVTALRIDGLFIWEGAAIDTVDLVALRPQFGLDPAAVAGPQSGTAGQAIAEALADALDGDSIMIVGAGNAGPFGGGAFALDDFAVIQANAALLAGRAFLQGFEAVGFLGGVVQPGHLVTVGPLALQVEAAAVPEPASAVLVALGAAALAPLIAPRRRAGRGGCGPR